VDITDPSNVHCQALIVLPLYAMLRCEASKLTVELPPLATVKFKVWPSVADWVPEDIVNPAVGALLLN
jgi:hypothetical protein